MSKVQGAGLRSAGGVLLLLGVALVGAGVAAAGMLAPTYQVYAVVGIILLVVVTASYVAAPAVVLTGYVFVLPLLLGSTESVRTSLGEVASVLILALAGGSLLIRPLPLPVAVKRIAWCLAGIAGLGLLSAIANDVTSPGDVVNGIFKYVVFALIPIVVYREIDSERKMDLMVKAVVYAGIVVALYSIYSYATGGSYYAQYGYSRAAGTFENWNELGGYMALVGLPLLMFGLASRSPLKKAVAVGGFALELVAMLLSFTLGSVLGLAVAGCVAVVMFMGRRPLRIIFIIGLMIVIGVLVTGRNSAVGEHFHVADQRVEDRIATYLAGLDVLRAHPWLGVGSQAAVLTTVTVAPGPGGTRVSVVPHNAFLAIAVEKGIFGGLLLLAVAGIGLRSTFAPSRLYGKYALVHTGILLGTIAFLVQNLSNLLLLHSRLGLLWLILVAVDARMRVLAKANAVSRRGEAPAAAALSRAVPAAN